MTKEELKIGGWLAKDESGNVTFFSVKPEKIIVDNELFWMVPGGACISMGLGYKKVFEPFTSDKPAKVEVIIRKTE